MIKSNYKRNKHNLNMKSLSLETSSRNPPTVSKSKSPKNQKSQPFPLPNTDSIPKTTHTDHIFQSTTSAPNKNHQQENPFSKENPVTHPLSIQINSQRKSLLSDQIPPTSQTHTLSCVESPPKAPSFL